MSTNSVKEKKKSVLIPLPHREKQQVGQYPFQSQQETFQEAYPPDFLLLHCKYRCGDPFSKLHIISDNSKNDRWTILCLGVMIDDKDNSEQERKDVFLARKIQRKEFKTREVELRICQNFYCF